jgi:glycosyltransferase involved in cell wall biosynthesis|tara:strand:- start:973 stop:2208 length:1236 start_codon:yes stop_codon:yes gene_type:complete
LNKDIDEKRMSVKILMVLDKAFPTDIRVEKEAISLVKAGYSVGILSIADYERNEVINHKGITVYRIALSKFIADKMHGLAAMIPWIDYYVAKKIIEVLSNEDYDAIHVHDLYLFGAIRLVRKKVNKWFVGDLHENYVDALKDYKWSTTYPNKLIVSISKWERKEKEWLQYFDRLIVVNEGMKDKNIAKGVPEDKISVVSNSIDTATFSNYEIDEAIIDRYQDFFTLIYVGGFVSNRGLEHVVKGMATVKEYNSNIKLLLVGDGEVMNTLQQLTKQLDLEDVIDFEGWQPQNKIRSYLEASNVGLVPFKRTPQTNNSSSNKLYQYMYFGVPVLATNCTSVKKLVDEEQCGIVYEEESQDQFSEHVIHLFEDAKVREKYSKNGREAVKLKYNWEKEAKKLINLYGQLEKEQKK